MARIVWMTLVMSLLLPVMAPGQAFGQTWDSIGEIDGVNVWRKEVEGSSLLAFKGMVIADVSIGQLMAVFTNPARRKDWVARHVNDKNLAVGPNFQEYWIHFATPFPVSDRDYVLRSDGIRDEANKTFTCKIKSVARKDAPKNDCCVRAHLNGTYYKFEAVPGPTPRTRLTVEVHTDPRGMLPKWLVNIIQKKWPSETLNGLVRQAKKETTPHPDYADWHK